MIPTVSSGSVFPGKQKKMNDGDGKKWKGIVTPDRKAGRQSFLEVRIAEGQKESLTRGDDWADQMTGQTRRHASRDQRAHLGSIVAL